jgi:hypothetical protein
VVVGCIIDHLANRKLRPRELLLELAKLAPLLEQDDCHFAQSKGFRAVPKNQNLTDALGQQGCPAMSAGLLRRQDLDIINHTLLGALTELAMVISSSTSPKKSRAAAQQTIVSMLDAWRA